MISRSNRVAANGAISFFFVAEQRSAVCMSHLFFIHSPVNGHFCCFFVLAAVSAEVSAEVRRHGRVVWAKDRSDRLLKLQSGDTKDGFEGHPFSTSLGETLSKKTLLDGCKLGYVWESTEKPVEAYGIMKQTS